MAILKRVGHKEKTDRHPDLPPGGLRSDKWEKKILHTHSLSLSYTLSYALTHTHTHTHTHTRVPYWTTHTHKAVRWCSWTRWCLKAVVRDKIIHYRQVYLNRPDPIAFMSFGFNTSGLIYDDFSRLLFLHAHREASDLVNELPEESISFPSRCLLI